MKLPIIHVSAFGTVLGLAGLGNAWRLAHSVWGLPGIVGGAINGLAAAIWAGLFLLYAAKWILARETALAELRHPIDCSLTGLVGVATMLIAGIFVPHNYIIALVLFLAGAAFTLGYAIWSTAAIWKDDRHHGTTTAALYIPTVAGSFVTGTVAAELGFPAWGQLAFGAGLFSWLAIESVLAHRLYAVDHLPPQQRPSLGIQFAPPVVGCVSYLSVAPEPSDLIATSFIGYGLLQGLVILRLVLWIREQPFAPSYWAFTFGSASLSIALLKILAQGGAGPAIILAPVVFVTANLVVGIISLATLRLLGRQLLRSMGRATQSAIQGETVISAKSPSTR